MSEVRVVTLAAEQLRTLIHDAVVDALAEVEGSLANQPALLDRTGLARALGLSVATVDKLRVDGCPVIRIGDIPKFELRAVLEWLRSRSGETSQITPQLSMAAHR